MKNIIITALGFLFVLSSCQPKTNQEKKQIKENVEIEHVKEISFYASDSIKIYGDLYETDKQATTVLLFHQAGSNAKGEYNSIIPELEKEGFNVLAIDQRSGGQLFGNYNRTVANIPYNKFSYCDAYSDLESALVFIKENGFLGKKILWGSSYSGSLAIKLANQYQNDINGVLAFSPASGRMEECSQDGYYKTLKIPLLLLRPTQEMEIESVKNQFELAQKNKHQVYIAKYGKHGSSMLVEERVKYNVDENWEVVKSFLEKFKNN